VLGGTPLLFSSDPKYGGTQTQREEPINFEQALSAARNPPKPIERWRDLSEYRLINEYRQPPLKAADGSTGHYLYHAADGTLYEATYPSGEIGIPVAHVFVLSDKEAYYIWEIRADGKQSFVDARTGEVLYVLPLSTTIHVLNQRNSDASYDRKHAKPRVLLNPHHRGDIPPRKP